MVIFCVHRYTFVSMYLLSRLKILWFEFSILNVCLSALGTLPPRGVHSKFLMDLTVVIKGS